VGGTLLASGDENLSPLPGLLQALYLAFAGMSGLEPVFPVVFSWSRAVIV